MRTCVALSSAVSSVVPTEELHGENYVEPSMCNISNTNGQVQVLYLARTRSPVAAKTEHCSSGALQRVAIIRATFGCAG